MRLAQLQLSGFRNFKKATINFVNKTLLIGPNDIGKSNLIHALRILLDRGLSDMDVEPKDSDFYAYEDTNEIIIITKFVEVTEECVVSKMKANLHDDGSFFLKYVGKRDPITKKKEFTFFAGRDESSFVEISGRFYTKVLNLQYIDSNRDLAAYIRTQKKHLLQEAKEGRTPEQIAGDSSAIAQIGGKLSEVNASVSGLSYISSATNDINKELRDLSFHNARQNIEFDSGESDPEAFVEDLQLVSKVGGKKIAIGGDGRNNQVFLAIWASRFEREAADPLEVTIFCIEEPEAHLHPHQQRKLAEYLAMTLPGQVVITSHSPQIACELPPNSIVRLYNASPETLAAHDGCANIIEKSIFEFGYRLNILPAEGFFATVVLLVEGPSEVLLYKALAEALKIDLDRLNISVISIQGVGFSPYLNLLDALMIRWVMRTDNDISKVPKAPRYRCAGLQRALNAFGTAGIKDAAFEKMLAEHRDKLDQLKAPTIPEPLAEAVRNLKAGLESHRIFLATTDLENDLAASPLQPALKDFFGDEYSPEEIVESMQSQKATFMFEFLRTHRDDLVKLKGDRLAAPLFSAEALAKTIDA